MREIVTYIYQINGPTLKLMNIARYLMSACWLIPLSTVPLNIQA